MQERRSIPVIDWEIAPVWANYIAKDSDHFWYWYENKPAAGLEGLRPWRYAGRRMFAFHELPPHARYDVVWFDSIQMRPSAIEES